MNHVLTTVTTSNPSSVLVTITPTSAAPEAGKPSMLHRVELRVALWLLLRNARRQEIALDHAERGRRRANSAARARREHEALRAWCTQSMHY
ncbi:hypothetical protein C5B85_09855 [Pseudoclavibacter sp. AY1F1]|uniref:hypothetical protein n=1 Tax=Pseudoclavibacter sp. AY1F1 TaxID=2080583 RepID=UPI000CE7C313|nr:hypothetical protein [Pseudoclavibacter sp. AY1F1]PPF44446.1 hypothetical protein C5B85_09855 [Pseudoclavibacter sp. AY1F1]